MRKIRLTLILILVFSNVPVWAMSDSDEMVLRHLPMLIGMHRQDVIAAVSQPVASAEQLRNGTYPVIVDKYQLSFNDNECDAVLEYYNDQLVQVKLSADVYATEGLKTLAAQDLAAYKQFCLKQYGKAAMTLNESDSNLTLKIPKVNLIIAIKSIAYSDQYARECIEIGYCDWLNMLGVQLDDQSAAQPSLDSNNQPAPEPADAD